MLGGNREVAYVGVFISTRFIDCHISILFVYLKQIYIHNNDSVVVYYSGS